MPAMHTNLLLESSPARPTDSAPDVPRYTVEPPSSLDSWGMYALRDVKTRRVVKLYRSGTVALTDARFLNTVRPPLPLG
jgi:hypothetical protein